MKIRSLVVWCVLSVALGVAALAQPFSEAQFKGMKWRDIGPYRGGRVLAVAGVTGSPYTYYFGGVAGGVWRTTDGGVDSECHLRGNGRVLSAREYLVRRWHV